MSQSFSSLLGSQCRAMRQHWAGTRQMFFWNNKWFHTLSLELGRETALGSESLALRSKPVTFAEFVLRGFVGLPWQSKQNSSDTNAWLSALINRLIICPWNLCDAGESQAFLRIIYTAINNLCCPLLASSVSALVIKPRRLSGPKAGAQWTC